MNITNTNDIITVIRDPANILGKKFHIDASGELQKKAVVTVSFCLAIMLEVPDCNALEKILSDVGNDTHAAIINASFKGIEVGEEFVILSEAEFGKRLNLHGRDKILGVHSITHNGKTYKAIARLKENVEPSSWQVLDRDIDEYTPSVFANATFEEWLKYVDMILPISNYDYLRAPSTSARVECI